MAAVALTRTATDVRPFQPHALIVADAAHGSCYGESEEQVKRRQVLEEKQWRADVIDLQRVMSISQALFLLLEHNNEALLRVATEIVTDRETAKSLWWEEGWYSNDDRRERFRKMVKLKLEKALAGPDGGHIVEEEDEVSKAMYDSLKARFDKVEGQFNAADRSKIIAESQVRELESAQSDLNEKLRVMEKTNEELRNRIRECEKELNDKDFDPSAGKAAELEKQVTSLEQQRNMAQERVKELEKQLADAGKSELLDAQKRMEELQRQLKESSELAEKMAKEAQAAKDELQKEKNKIKPKEAPMQDVRSKHGPRIDQDEFDAMRARLDSAQGRLNSAEKSAKQRQDDLARAQAEMDEMRGKYETMEDREKKAEQRAEKAETRADQADKREQQAADKLSKADEEIQRLTLELQRISGKVEAPKEVKPSAPRPVQGVPQEEVDKLLAELEKSKERNKRFKAENDELKQKNTELEEKQLKMLKMLHDIKEQLRRVTEIAEKKGLGDVVKQILEESKVSTTLESEEYTCFNRLYDDAKRRQEKQRQLQEQKFGITQSKNRAQWAGIARRASQTMEPMSYEGGDSAGLQSYQSQGFGHETPFGSTDPGSWRGGGQSASPMGFNGMAQRTFPGGSQPSSNPASPLSSQTTSAFRSGGDPSQTWHAGHPGPTIHEGNLYATGMNQHLGGQRIEHAPVSPSMRAHPAGTLEMLAQHRMQQRPFNGFAVQGYNPSQSPPPPPLRVPARTDWTGSPSGHAARPFGLAASASAGALSSGLSPMGVSAMAMDATARERASSSSPPPVRRTLFQSDSAPRLGQELPPLANETLRTSPMARDQLPSPGPSRLRPGMNSTISGDMRADSKFHRGRHPLQRSTNRLLPNDLEATWRAPRAKHVDDVLVGRESAPPGAGLTGWTLSGHNAEGASP